MMNTRAGIIVYRIFNDKLQLLMITPKITFATLSIFKDTGQLKESVFERMSSHERKLYSNLTVDKFKELTDTHYCKSKQKSRYDKYKNDPLKLEMFVNHVKNLAKRDSLEPLKTFPKGSVETKDYQKGLPNIEAYKRAACRELYEETGFELDSSNCTDRNLLRITNEQYQLYFWVIKCETDFEPQPIDSNEVLSSEWQTFDNQLLRSVSRDTKIILAHLGMYIESSRILDRRS